MATIHELAEIRIGDIPYTVLKYFPDKSRMEREAMADLVQQHPECAEKFKQLFAEFEDGQTPEARFVRAVDKLEMLITAAEYERTGVRSLLDFWQNEATFAAFADFPELEQLVRNLKSGRAARLSGKQATETPPTEG